MLIPPTPLPRSLAPSVTTSVYSTTVSKALREASRGSTKVGSQIYVPVLSPENAVLVRGTLASRPEPATAVPSPTGLLRSAGI